jgi:uncharacterized protein YpmS
VAKSVSAGQLPLPPKYVMSILSSQNFSGMPSWIKVDSKSQSIIFDLVNSPKIKGTHFTAVKIDPKNEKFVFRGELQNLNAVTK